MENKAFSQGRLQFIESGDKLCCIITFIMKNVLCMVMRQLNSEGSTRKTLAGGGQVVGSFEKGDADLTHVFLICPVSDITLHEITLGAKVTN